MYDFDPTAANPANLITNELHSIGAVNGTDLNYFVSKNGPFYASTLVIVDAATGRELAPDEYTLGHRFELASESLKREVYYVVALNNTAASGSYYLRMQILGGEFSLSSNKLLDDGIIALSRLTYINFEDITDYPDVFPPGAHETSLVSIDGAEEVLTQIVELVDYLKSSDRNVSIDDVSGMDSTLIQPLLLSLNDIASNISNLTDNINSIWYEYNTNGNELILNPTDSVWVDLPIAITIGADGIYSIERDIRPEFTWTNLTGRYGFRWVVDGVTMVNSTAAITRAAFVKGQVVSLQYFITEPASMMELADGIRSASLILRKVQNIQHT